MEKSNNVTKTFTNDVSISGANSELKPSPKYFWNNSDTQIDSNTLKINSGTNIVSNDNTIVKPFDMSVTTKSDTGVGSSLLTGETSVSTKTLPKKKKLKKSEIKQMRESIQNAIKPTNKFLTVSDDVYTESHLKLAKDLLQKTDNKIMSALLQKSGTFPTTESWMKPRPPHEAYYESKASKLNKEIDNENLEKLLLKSESDSIPSNSICTVRNGQICCDVLEEKLFQKDDVNNPKHYNSEVFPQVIDMMLTTFSKADVLAFCKLNSFKYRMRAGIKDSTKIEEDIKKAIWYENKFIELNQVESIVKQIIKG